MGKKKLIRAWKDPRYRASLRDEELELMSEHPSGELELSSPGKVNGGVFTEQATCGIYTQCGCFTQTCQATACIQTTPCTCYATCQYTCLLTCGC